MIIFLINNKRIRHNVQLPSGSFNLLNVVIVYLLDHTNFTYDFIISN